MVNKEDSDYSKPNQLDSRAYEALFLTYYKNLVLYAKKFVVETEVARDIVQDVYIYLWEKRHDIQINHSITPYLFKSVKNACINHLKRDTLKADYIKNFLLSVNNANGPESLASDAHQELCCTDLMNKIEITIESLPEQCKNMFRMSRFGGLKNKEIAKVYAVSTRTVETQIYRALKVLKKKLVMHLQITAFFFVFIAS